MDDLNLNDHGSAEAHIIEDLMLLSMRIEETIRHDCPLFSQYQSRVRSRLFEVEKTLGIHLSLDHPAEKLNNHTYALQMICWQILYSVVRLNTFADWASFPPGQNTLTSYYNSYYFFDFISRGKAVIDITGLMINHVFGLGITNERCGLDKGAISAALARMYDGRKEHEYINNLYRNLDRHRNNWISDFYELRNIVIHRHEFGSLAIAVTCIADDGSERTHPFIAHFLETPETIKYVRSIAPGSLIDDSSVDPILFCSELWQKLVSLIECACEGCCPHIDEFFRAHRDTF
jgi:hypothetical protein